MKTFINTMLDDSIRVKLEIPGMLAPVTLTGPEFDKYLSRKPLTDHINVLECYQEGK